MDEYIKKNQALCCFSGWIDQNGDFHEPDEMIEYQRIEQLPPADAVPVVRCKDCKYWKTAEGVNLSKKVKFCTYAIDHSYARHDEDFCSRGELKGDGNG